LTSLLFVLSCPCKPYGSYIEGVVKICSLSRLQNPVRSVYVRIVELKLYVEFCSRSQIGKLFALQYFNHYNVFVFRFAVENGVAGSHECIAFIVQYFFHLASAFLRYFYFSTNSYKSQTKQLQNTVQNLTENFVKSVYLKYFYSEIGTSRRAVSAQKANICAAI